MNQMGIDPRGIRLTSSLLRGACAPAYEQTPMIDRSRRLPLRTKLAFSAGALEEAMVGAASMATMLFYNQFWAFPRACVAWCS